MQKAIGWQLVLFVVVLLCGAMPSQAQEESKQNSDTAKANVERPAKAAHAYCVDLSIHELENGKIPIADRIMPPHPDSVQMDIPPAVRETLRKAYVELL